MSKEITLSVVCLCFVFVSVCACVCAYVCVYVFFLLFVFFFLCLAINHVSFFVLLEICRNSMSLYIGSGVLRGAPTPATQNTKTSGRPSQSDPDLAYPFELEL